MKKLFFYTFALALFTLGGCSDDDPQLEIPPSVTFANEEGIFEVKIGRSLVIEPIVSGVIDPFYVWKLDGEIVSRDTTFEFSSKTPGQYFVTFQVSAANGQLEKEARIDVLELTPPKVQLPVDGGYISAVTGRKLDIVPEVMHRGKATYQWLLNREEVSTDSVYTFQQEELGDYNLVLIVTNEDGEGRTEAIVRVSEVPELSFWFESENIPAPINRKAIIAPYVSYATANTTYQWEIDGVKQSTNSAILGFTPTQQKDYIIKVSGTEGEQTVTATITVKGVAPAGTYFRAASSGSSKYTCDVLDFLPAPGQFVNEGYTATTREQANAYAKGRLESNAYVSLGGFGGYIVVKFDHSVENTAGYDLAIQGNAFSGSSEPGIVWVMQDDNGNGLPDDTWYELKGSETGKPSTRQQHAVTYYKPTGSRQNIRWTDNNKESGTIDINGFHSQESYYPNWITATSYTLRGTYLEARNYDQSGNGSYWINSEYEWGYADNYSVIDYINNETLLELDNAIYPDGTPVELKYIDFVKVQVAVNAKSGWLGEVSTEVSRFRDMN